MKTIQVSLPESQSEVKEAHNAIMCRIKELREEERLLKGMIDRVQSICSHPNKYRDSDGYGTSATGSTCPDCGWSNF